MVVVAVVVSCRPLFLMLPVYSSSLSLELRLTNILQTLLFGFSVAISSSGDRVKVCVDYNRLYQLVTTYRCSLA